LNPIKINKKKLPSDFFPKPVTSKRDIEVTKIYIKERNYNDIHEKKAQSEKNNVSP